MRNLFTYPAIEIKNFETENIVTVSVTGTSYEGDIEVIKNDMSYTRAIVDAKEVLHFN